jgi:hypothetical protein
MSPIAGLAMSVALVVVLVAPAGLGGIGRPIVAPTPAATGTIIDREIEAVYIISVRQGTLAAAPAVVPSGGSYPRNYPDGIKPERKEVGPAGPSGRPPEAI